MSRASGDWTQTYRVEARLMIWDSRPGIGVVEVAHGLYLPVWTEGQQIDPMTGPAVDSAELGSVLMAANEDAAWDCAVRAQQQRDSQRKREARRDDE